MTDLNEEEYWIRERLHDLVGTSWVLAEYLADIEIRLIKVEKMLGIEMEEI